MSYAAVASHNSKYSIRQSHRTTLIAVPEGEMPKPDQNLADGHFEGETHESENLDGKVWTLTATTGSRH